MIEFDNIKEDLEQVGGQIEELFNESFKTKKHLQAVTLRTAALQSAVFFSMEMMTKLFPAIDYEMRLYGSTGRANGVVAIIIDMGCMRKD